VNETVIEVDSEPVVSERVGALGVESTLGTADVAEEVAEALLIEFVTVIMTLMVLPTSFEVSMYVEAVALSIFE
jgi:hypothetical protein